MGWESKNSRLKKVNLDKKNRRKGKKEWQASEGGDLLDDRRMLQRDGKDKKEIIVVVVYPKCKGKVRKGSTCSK